MGKFYWLKLKKDIFKRHDMLNLRSDPEKGLIFEAIFIHLMTESIDHDGCLRYSDKKPYSARTLAPLVSTNEKTMKEALDLFEELELIEILADGTIRIPMAIENIGSESEWADKKRRFRDTKRTEEGQSEDNVLNMSSESPENVRKMSGQKRTMSDKSIEIRDKRKDIRKENNKLFSSLSREIPTKDDVLLFASENKLEVDIDLFYQIYSEQGWKIEGKPIRNWKALLLTWSKNKTWSKEKDIKYMQNEYSSEHIRQKEKKSMEDLDDLLEE